MTDASAVQKRWRILLKNIIKTNFDPHVGQNNETASVLDEMRDPRISLLLRKVYRLFETRIHAARDKLYSKLRSKFSKFV